MAIVLILYLITYCFPQRPIYHPACSHYGSLLCTIGASLLCVASGILTSIDMSTSYVTELNAMPFLLSQNFWCERLNPQTHPKARPGAVYVPSPRAGSPSSERQTPSSSPPSILTICGVGPLMARTTRIVGSDLGLYREGSVLPPSDLSKCGVGPLMAGANQRISIPDTPVEGGR